MENNNGLIAVQNKEKRMIFENALKSYTTLIAGIGADNEMIHTLLGSKEAKELSELGITKFCYKKTEEVLKQYPFPSMPKETTSEVRCKKCGSATKNKTGVKNGKKWEANFCQNKDCGNPNWVSKTPYTQHQEEEANRQDAIEDEASQQYDESIPPEFQ
jgi:hypothetical protein